MDPFKRKNLRKHPQQGANKQGNIKVGDIVLLKCSLQTTVHYKGFISADGVISRTLEVIPKHSQHGQGANVITRSCLFRLENARRVTQRTLEKSESELQMALGKALTYGDRIQLRHLHSGGFVAVENRQIASEPGTLQTIVQGEGLENSWFEIHPVNRLRKDGESIRYSDPLYFQSSAEKSKYFLHCNEGNLSYTEAKTEVNASGNTFSWHVRKFMDYSLCCESPSVLTTGDSFRVYHRASDGYLAVARTQFIGEVTTTQVFVQRGNHTANSL